MRFIKVVFVFVIFIMLGCNEKYRYSRDNSEQKDIVKSELSVKPDEELIITEDILFNSDIWAIEKTYGFGGIDKIFKELAYRVNTKKDVKALNRLFDYPPSLDGYVAEDYSAIIGELYRSDIKYFLENSYEHKNAESIYCDVIYSLYFDRVADKQYPENYLEIKALGHISDKFMKTYEWYLKNGF